MDVGFTKAVAALCQALNSNELKSDIVLMCGYETHDTGNVVYENA